jgi:hypothetical protein
LPEHGCDKLSALDTGRGSPPARIARGRPISPFDFSHLETIKEGGHSSTRQFEGAHAQQAGRRQASNDITDYSQDASLVSGPGGPTQCDAMTDGKGNKIMRNRMLAILALFAAGTAMIAGSAPAAAGDYPWCVTGGQLGAGGGDCNYQTLAQCQASASGRWNV